MKKENSVNVILAIFTIVIWILPESISTKTKFLISGILLLSILLILFKEKLYIFRKYWQEIVSIALLSAVFLLFYNVYPELSTPAIIIILTSVLISTLLSLKFKQGFVFKTKEFLDDVPINVNWNLNHWGSDCARIENSKMIFTGLTAPPTHKDDGSHIDLHNILQVGNTYEISCYARSYNNTTGLFKIWCHDQTGEQPFGSKAQTIYRTPSKRGEIVKLNFKAEFNSSIRIHLQYTPGLGSIEISRIKIYRLKI